jgi:hypothetical protein
MKVGLEINEEETRHVLVSHHQNADQNWGITLAHT